MKVPKSLSYYHSISPFLFIFINQFVFFSFFFAPSNPLKGWFCGKSPSSVRLQIKTFTFLGTVNFSFYLSITHYLSVRIGLDLNFVLYLQRLITDRMSRFISRLKLQFCRNWQVMFILFSNKVHKQFLNFHLKTISKNKMKLQG